MSPSDPSVPKSLLINRYLSTNMKLQKQLSRKYGGKEYAKYVIVVKPELIRKLGWKDGEKLEPEVQGEKLIIKMEN
jgi:hypothetical protein